MEMGRLFLGALAALAILGMVAGAVLAWYVFSGRYNIAATEPHFAPVRHALDNVYRASVRHQAAGIAPPLLDRARAAEGTRPYATHCSRCHALPGGERPGWAEGMRPSPPHLPRHGTEFDTAEIYWLVRHGVRMTGMPPWQDVLSDEEMWSVAALVSEMPISEEDYQELSSEAESGS